MLDGFVPGAHVTAVSSDTPATVSSSDAGRVPEDPGDMGIDALFAPRPPADADEDAVPSGTGASGAVPSGAIPSGAIPSGAAPTDAGPSGAAADAAADAPGTDATGAAGGADGGGTPPSGSPSTDGSAWAFLPPDGDGDDDGGPETPSPGSGQPAAAPGAPAAGASDTASAIEEEPPASPRERLRDFALDSRMRIWRRRILITVIAGGVFSIIFTWRLGLTIAVIVAIADTVWRSRTMASVPPGVKVTHAQRMTQRQLGRLERSGYRALHSRPIPGSKEFIDHLVVGPTGVYAIDSEKWDRRLPIRTRNARQLWHGPESKKDRLEHAKWEAERASTLISGNLRSEVIVRPSMAVYGPKIPWDIATIRDVDVFKGSRLKKYIRKRGKISTERLSDAEIEKIYRAAMTVLPY
jgi:hypothetical protein